MQFPEHLARFSSVNPRSVVETINPNKKSYSHSARRATTGQRFGFDLTTVKLSFEKAVELGTFIEQLEFDFTKFYIYNPMPVMGSGGGTPQTRQLVERDEKAVPIDGLPASSTGVWKVGDFIQFANHTKVYKITSVLNSNGIGQGTAQIFPALITDVPDDTAISFGSDVNFKVELESEVDDILFAVSDGKLQSIDINVVEVS